MNERIEASTHDNADTVLVSISCITYNQERYVRDCLDGFLNQQCTFNFEILIHDDASTDATADIIREYCQRYPEIIKPLFQKENQYSKGVRGVMARFNFPRARGKYIAMCEGDDYWTDPLKLQKQVDFLEANPDYAICFHAANELSPDGSSTKSGLFGKEARDTYTIEDLAAGNFMHTLTVVFRNQSPYPDWIKESPVGDYVLHYVNAGLGKIKYLPEVMGCYRTGVGVWSAAADKARLTKWLIVLDLLIQHTDRLDLIKILSAQKISIWRGLKALNALEATNPDHALIRQLLDTIDEKQDRLQQYTNEQNLESNFSGKSLIKAIIRKTKKRMGL